MTASLVLFFFLVLFALVLLLVSLGIRLLEVQRKKKVAGILRTASGEPERPETKILVNAPGPRQGPRIPALSSLSIYRLMETQLRQAGLSWSPTQVLAMMVVAALVGALLGMRVHVPVFRELGMVSVAGLLGALPYLYVLRTRRRRLAQFEEQFPETLEFLARSMRAGHAFTVSLETIAEESPEPVGSEFRKVFHEQNLGSPIDVVLRNMAERTPLLDVRFFVSAVLMQRETGGNLAEILTKLAYVIRERFRLKGQVRAASAHGRITALILSVMPMFLILGLMVVAPGYLESMAKDVDGRRLIIGAIIGQLVGYYWMRTIINIKV